MNRSLEALPRQRNFFRDAAKFFYNSVAVKSQLDDMYEKAQRHHGGSLQVHRSFRARSAVENACEIVNLSLASERVGRSCGAA